MIVLREIRTLVLMNDVKLTEFLRSCYTSP